MTVEGFISEIVICLIANAIWEALKSMRYKNG